MCGFLFEGCCNHLVHIGDGGMGDYWTNLQTEITLSDLYVGVYLLMCFGVLGFHVWYTFFVHILWLIWLT